MIRIGCHLSVAAGCAAMGRTALSLGADTFAFFTRNPRGGRSAAIDPADAAALGDILQEHNFGTLVAHASYTMNLCAANPVTRLNALEMLEDDFLRMRFFPGQYYNFHPGAHVGQGEAAGVALIAEALNRFLTPDQPFTVLLETMAGKGTEIGGSFKQLGEILSRVELKDKVGVCFDTCHVWDAGYDIAGDPDGVLTRFDREIGLGKLLAVHLNDSKNPCGARKDRHEKLGEGNIGEAALRRLTLHPALAGLPFILETPNDDAGYMREIAAVRSWQAEI